MSGPGEDAAAAALAALPGMGPARLRALLCGRAPSEAWAAVRAGRLPVAVLATMGRDPGALRARWHEASAAIDPQDFWRARRATGIEMVRWGSPGYPAALAEDPEPPAVLFWRGDLDLADRGARVAIVGTRRCTPTGAAVAADLGAALSAAGVTVVSGLALGIDAAAHRGALGAAGAAPVAVVGSGLDVVYPRANAALWAGVARSGLLVSEAPPGAAPLPWRFPARNRIIAALADVVVVVESPASGGALHTAAEAVDRDVPVLAVPGSVRSPASAGTNELLHSGAGPARDALDVLVALGLEGRVPGPGSTTGDPTTGEASIDPQAREVLDALGGDPATVDELAARCACPLGALTGALDRLVEAGAVQVQGAWYCRVR